MSKGITTFALSVLLAPAAWGADAAAGKADYDKSCKSCHGASGTANPAMAKMMKVEMKDLGSAEVQAESDAVLKAVIVSGKGKMRPVTTVTGTSADNVVAYMRTFKK
jgi:cytochrome c5